MNKEFEKNKDLGWDDFFESKKAELELSDFSVARVITENRGSYRVKDFDGEFLAKITGKQMFESESRENYPAVGDWVAINKINDEQAVIQAILPRKSIIKRTFGDKNRVGGKNDIQVIATNVDVAFLVQSVGRDYNVNRFERYLTIVKDDNITPVIIINKIDLISEEELELKLSEIKNRLDNIKIIATSTVNNKGLEKLKNYIKKGETYCFLGSSGVGKSSLINKLLEKEIVKTGEIGLQSDRGRHVTTNREIYFLDNGGIVIDNPGIREVGIADTEIESEDVFERIASFAKNCKYSDCTHIHEPGCGVLTALEDGMLDRDKYNNYINLKKEAEYLNQSKSQKKEKNRQFGKFMKKAKKDLKNFGHKDYQ